MDFVILANAWSAAENNPTGKHQIALCLATKGHRVLWIEGSGMRRPAAASTADRSRILAKLLNAAKGIRNPRPGIHYISPIIVPLPGHPWIRTFNAIVYTLTGVVGSWCIGLRRPVLINFLPVVPRIERFWPWKTVYFCVDRWDRFAMYDSAMMNRVDTECCRYADVVLTTSRELQNRCAPKNPATFFIGHGVDRNHFRAPLFPADDTPPIRPPDLPDGPVIGFFGLLSEWVDQMLLLRLARALAARRPDPSALVLIGAADVDITRLREDPNIHILGSKTFQELPAYTVFFHAAIIPFVVNELTAAVNPIKLREMLAAGCPVVSTALPEVASMAAANPFIDVTGTSAAFVNAVLARLEEPDTLERRRTISETVRNETWSAKVDEILEVIA